MGIVGQPEAFGSERNRLRAGAEAVASTGERAVVETLRTLVSWSSGKDSAWALHLLGRDPRYDVCGLLTTVNREFDRVAMHSTRREVVEAQARAAGLPLQVVSLPWPCSNELYERAMQEAIGAAVAAGVQCIAFGDLYLEDVRRYRERMLEGSGIVPVFPLWGMNTDELMERMLASRVRATVVCVDPAKLPRSFAGREVDAAFVGDLPKGVDPCGENGEFHTCVHDGPMFHHEIPTCKGAVVERDGFVFADVLLDGRTPVH